MTPKRAILLAIVVAYIVVARFVYRGNMVYWQHECGRSYCDDKRVAQIGMLSLASAIVPVWWPVSYFFTGGFYYGFSYDPSPAIKDR